MNPTQPTAPASKATPLPWHVCPNPSVVGCVKQPNGKCVVAMAFSEHDAAFIVRACNSHAALVEALSAMYCAGFWTADELPNLPDHQRKAITAARAALTAAQE
jgi:hypothetical protein